MWQGAREPSGVNKGETDLSIFVTFPAALPAARWSHSQITRKYRGQGITPETRRFFIFPRKKGIFAMGRGHSLLCATKLIFIVSGTLINALPRAASLRKQLLGVNN